MMPQVSTSFHGKLINIDYVLKLFVKHDSWNELGEGQVVSLPVQIMMPPMQIAPEQPQVQVPVDWNPQMAQLQDFSNAQQM